MQTWDASVVSSQEEMQIGNEISVAEISDTVHMMEPTGNTYTEPKEIFLLILCTYTASLNPFSLVNTFNTFWKKDISSVQF